MFFWPSSHFQPYQATQKDLSSEPHFLPSNGQFQPLLRPLVRSSTW